MLRNAAGEVSPPGAAQSSANRRRADAAGQVRAASAGAMMNASAVAQVNQRVSDLGDHTTVVEADAFL